MVVEEARRRDERRTGVGSRAFGVAGTGVELGEEKFCWLQFGDCFDLFFGVSAMDATAEIVEEVELPVAVIPSFTSLFLFLYRVPVDGGASGRIGQNEDNKMAGKIDRNGKIPYFDVVNYFYFLVLKPGRESY